MIRLEEAELAGLMGVKVRVTSSKGGSLYRVRTGNEYLFGECI
jgi:hypothetical protein